MIALIVYLLIGLATGWVVGRIIWQGQPVDGFYLCYAVVASIIACAFWPVVVSVGLLSRLSPNWRRVGDFIFRTKAGER